MSPWTLICLASLFWCDKSRPAILDASKNPIVRILAKFFYTIPWRTEFQSKNESKTPQEALGKKTLSGHISVYIKIPPTSST